MTTLGYILWAVFFLVVILGAWRDARRSDKREREDDALRKFGPMD